LTSGKDWLNKLRWFGHEHRMEKIEFPNTTVYEFGNNKTER